MSADRANLVYRFPNATVIRCDRGTVKNSKLLADGVQVFEDKSILSEEVAKRLGYLYTIYGPSQGELNLIRVVTTEVVDSYIPQKSGLLELSEEDYGRLSPAFKKLYEKRVGKPEEKWEQLPIDVLEIEGELTDGLLIGKHFPTDLHRYLNGIREQARRVNSWGSSNDKERPDFERALPLKLTAKEIVSVLSDHIIQPVRSSPGITAFVNTGYGIGNDELVLEFFAKRYDGAMKKVLDTKKDGKPYADRRGHMVKDFPDKIGRAAIPSEQLGEWWESIGGNELPDDQKLAALKALAGRLTGLESAS